MAQVQLRTVVRRLRSLAGETDAQLLDAFARGRDEGAFAALVRRHGALVMGVCRRTLGHCQDAEDAFQATFLVLARSARPASREGSLAAWLYGVAHRIAMNAKRSLARRRARERRAARPEVVLPPAGPSWQEVQALLDEEVQRLPAIYQRVFVLCCLGEKTRAEAARELGLKEGTVASRLAKARKLLQERLASRGVTLSTLLAVLGVAREGAGAAAIEATAAGVCASSVPPRVAALADGVTPAMPLMKPKFLALLLAGLLAGGAGLLFAAVGAGPAKEGPAAPKKSPAAVVGRVLDPAGRPVKGARVYQVLPWERDDRPGVPPKLLAESDAGGKFEVRTPPARGASWVAVAPGFGPAVAAAPVGRKITLRLVTDVPVAGRIVNLEGRPVKGVTIRPLTLGITEKEDLEPLLEGRRPLDEVVPRKVGSPAGVPGLPARLTTDADGRFRLAGVGRERVVALEVSGPTIEHDLIVVMTRSGKPFRVSPEGGMELRVYPATFQHPASPPRPLAGAVRDSRTGKPIPGVAIDVGMGPLVRATTGKDGTYRLDSLPGLLLRSGRESLTVLAIPPADKPYLPGRKEVDRGRRLAPLRADFKLPLGVWAEGRVTDKRTGKPIRAQIEYVAAPRNPALKGYPDYPARDGRLFLGLWSSGADGRFRIPVLPGVGALVARVPSGAYLPDESLTDDQAADLGLPPPRLLLNFHAVARIEARAGARVKCDLAVDSGQTLTCKLLDPAGKPVKGARVGGLQPQHYWTRRPLPGETFTLQALHPRRPRWVVVLLPERRLGAAVEVKAGAREPLPIRLARTGKIAGRLLDPDGLPWKRQGLWVDYDRRPGRYPYPHFPGEVRTDDRGHFEVVGVIPGVVYQLRVAGKDSATFAPVATRLSLRPGEARDLKDVKARLHREKE
jgi:RNA polymerase sigma factor (sigma-70 family)